MTTQIPVVRAVSELRDAVAPFRAASETVALVPTMGALHEGHVSLVRLARERCRRVVVSIFVNPMQFAPGEDLSRYPRDEAGDLAKLAEAGVDLVWAPGIGDMYPEGFATLIVVGGPSEGLESEPRPNHFAGVATICCKLFAAVQPDIAVFGEKDYQQLCVLRRMVSDLNLPLELVAGPTVREPAGFALSSRNRYLSPEERRIAPALHAVLTRLAESVAKGQPSAAALDALCARAKARLLAAGFTKVDYVAVREAETLAPFDSALGRPGRVLAAAWLGTTRLIDNVAVAPLGSGP